MENNKRSITKKSGLIIHSSNPVDNYYTNGKIDFAKMQNRFLEVGLEDLEYGERARISPALLLSIAANISEYEAPTKLIIQDMIMLTDGQTMRELYLQDLAMYKNNGNTERYEHLLKIGIEGFLQYWQQEDTDPDSTEIYGDMVMERDFIEGIDFPNTGMAISKKDRKPKYEND